MRMNELASSDNPQVHIPPAPVPVVNGNVLSTKKAKKRKKKSKQKVPRPQIKVLGKISEELQDAIHELEQFMPTGFSVTFSTDVKLLMGADNQRVVENANESSKQEEEEEIQPPPEFTVNRSEFSGQSELFQLDDVEPPEKNSETPPISEDTEKVVLRYQLEAAQQAILNMETELSSLRSHEETLRKSFSQVTEKVEHLESRMEKIEDQLKETLNTKLCKKCGQNDREVVLMPCLHFLYCSQCARDWKTCLQCNSIVAGFLNLKTS